MRVACDSQDCTSTVEVEDIEQEDPIWCDECAQFWIMVMNRNH